MFCTDIIVNTSICYFNGRGIEQKVIDGVKIAFHMHKDDCPAAIMLFHCFYPTIWLEYPPVVGDHHFFCILYKKYCEHARYFGDRGSER